MTGDAKSAVPKKLKKWREEGQILEVQGKKIFVHDQGPKVDDAVFIVHGYPGSSWDFQDVVKRIGDKARTVVDWAKQKKQTKQNAPDTTNGMSGQRSEADTEEKHPS